MGGSFGKTIGRVAIGAVGFGLGSAIGYPALGASLGLSLGSFIFPNKQEGKVRQVRAAMGTSSVEGIPLSIVFGRVRIGGTLMWIGSFQYHEIKKKAGGKGGSASVVTDAWYTLSFAMIIGEGEMALTKIWDGKDVVEPSYTFYSGSSDQLPDSFLSSQTGKSIGYRNTAYIVLQDYNVGPQPRIPQLTFEVTSGQSKFDVELVLEDVDGDLFKVTKTEYIDVFDINNFITPAYAINKLISNDRYGGGFTKTVDWLEANTDCLDRNYLFNMAFTERRSLSSMIEIIGSHGWITSIFSGSSIKLILSKNDTPSKTINIDDLLAKKDEQAINVSESAKSERFNRLSVEFTDPEKDYSVRPLMVEDLADQQDRGIYKTSLSIPGFHDPVIVKDVGYKMLRNSLFARRIINFSLGPEFLDLEAGDLAYINAETVGLSQMRTRLIGIDETEDFNLIVTFREEPSYIYDPVTYATQASLAPPSKNTSSGLSNAVDFRIEEMPKELALNTGNVELSLVYSKQNADTIGFDIYWSLDDSSYNFLQQSRQPLNYGTIVTDYGKDSWLDTSDLVIDTTPSPTSTFSTISRIDMMGGSNLALVGEELVHFQTASLGETNTYTLTDFVRNRFNTKPISNPVGTPFTVLDSADTMSFLKSKIGTKYYFKAVPVNLFGNTGDISEVTSVGMTVQGWSYRPYAPGSIWLEEDGINQRSREITNNKDVKIAWNIVDKFTGFGRQGFNYGDYGSYTQDEDYTGSEVDVYGTVGLTFSLFRTADVGLTQNYTYTEAFNLADNVTLVDDLTFRVYTKSVYGRSKYYAEKTIKIV